MRNTDGSRTDRDGTHHAPAVRSGWARLVAAEALILGGLGFMWLVVLWIV